MADDWGNKFFDDIEKRENAQHPVERLVSIILTIEQAEKLEEVLFDHCDEGPMYEGWASPELDELRIIVEKAVEKANE